MLKRRVIIGLMFDDGVLVRTKRFIPDYRYTQEFLATEAIDEALLVDVTRAGPSVASRRAIAAFADRCFAPVTVGGHIASLADVAAAFALGADKVVLGRAALEAPDLVTLGAEKWGSQAIVVACDVLNGEVVHGRSQQQRPNGGRLAWDFAAAAEMAGAGEIYLQSVDRDGSLSGYDVGLLGAVAGAVSIPVTIGGGCGSWRHMEEAFEAGASGAVTTCVHHWTESALRGFKARLHGAGQPVRVAA